MLTSIAVAATAASFSERFDSFERVGGVIGTSVSAAFLLILALVNLWILYKLVKEMRRLILAGENNVTGGEWESQQVGCMMQVFKGAFRTIDRPWKMYPLGMLCKLRVVLQAVGDIADWVMQLDWGSIHHLRYNLDVSNRRNGLTIAVT